LPQDSKSHKAIWFINSPTGFPPATFPTSVNSFKILEVLFNLSPLTSSKYSESSPRLPELQNRLMATSTKAAISWFDFPIFD
jgi:hypothetical protein